VGGLLLHYCCGSLLLLAGWLAANSTFHQNAATASSASAGQWLADWSLVADWPS
jgi:hypothetical protein